MRVAANDAAPSLGLDAGGWDADRTGALMRVFTGTVPAGRTRSMSYMRHRFVFPLVAHAVRATCHRRGAAESVEIPRGGCVAMPAGSEASWSFIDPFRFAAVEVAPQDLRDFAQRDMRMLVAGNRIDGRLCLRAQQLGPVARRLERCVREDGPGSDVLLDALSRVFLITLIREYAVPDTTPATFGVKFQAARFAKLQEFIAERLDGPIRVADLAEAVGMSTSALTRALKTTVNLTPAQLVLDARVRRARELLEGSGDPIAAIASRCGFADQAHLTRSFRQAYGTTPLGHRKAAARGQAA